MTGHTAKMRRCPHCGDDLGVLTIAEWEPGDTCGKPDCEREARDAVRAGF